MANAILAIEDSVSNKMHHYNLNQIEVVVEEALAVRVISSAVPAGVAHIIDTADNLRQLLGVLRDVMVEGGSVTYRIHDAIWTVFKNNEKLGIA